MQHLKNEEECLKVIEEWRELSPEAQVRNLNRAIETMELDLMYYQEKGSDRIAEKYIKCLETLNKSLSEVKT